MEVTTPLSKPQSSMPPSSSPWSSTSGLPGAGPFYALTPVFEMVARDSARRALRGKVGLPQALDELLEIVRRAKDWQEGEARKQMLNLFDFASEPELVGEYRKKLASALY